MNRLVTALLALAFVSYMAAGAFATDAIVKHRATLRMEPSTENPPITTLHPPEDVELIDPSPTRGYYHVRTAEGDEGWVYSRNLEIVTANPSATAAPPAPAR